MDSSMNDFSPTPKKSSSGIIIAIIVLLLLAGGAYYFFNVQTKKTPKQSTAIPTVEPTVAVTETPTSTPSGTLAPSKEASPTARPTTGAVDNATQLNLQVLNGSGTVGIAGEVRDHLSGKGYKNIDTDNADNFDYKNVTINIKASRQKFLTDIQDALKDKYTLAASGTLSSSSTYDAVIIVGK